MKTTITFDGDGEPYLGSASAVYKNGVSCCAVLVYAKSQAEAIGRMLIEARNTYPQEQGYFNHQCSVNPLSYFIEKMEAHNGI